MKKETKRERFVRIAEKRTQTVIDALHALGKCHQTEVYEYTQEDVDAIFKAIEGAVLETKALMKAQKRFSLSENEKETSKGLTIIEYVEAYGELEMDMVAIFNPEMISEDDAMKAIRAGEYDPNVVTISKEQWQLLQGEGM